MPEREIPKLELAEALGCKNKAHPKLGCVVAVPDNLKVNC